MLAPHRDVENQVHGHHPKTPGTRYPKTPLRRDRNDENAPTAFAGKNTIGGASRLAGVDKSMTKGNTTRQPLVTPMNGRSRAVLGNKTTNAKARTGQVVGVKDLVKEIEKTQVKPTTTQKLKQKSAEVAPIKFDVKLDEEETPEDDEPEYAPPAPKPLPYESDCLPPGGLTFEGLKNENLLKGFYSHFHNPVDENGVSRKDREFAEEMKAVVDRAVERNERDADALDWTVSDVPETARLFRKKADPVKQTTAVSGPAKRAVPKQRQPPSLASRRAASALAMPVNAKKPTLPQPMPCQMPVRRPLSSLLPGNKASKGNVAARPASTSTVTAEAASRTTLGYNKGRSASSMVQHGRSNLSRAGTATVKTSHLLAEHNDLTITPARVRQAALAKSPTHEEQPRPQFMSIFDDDDDEDLAPLSRGQDLLDEDEEEFELKWDI